MAQDRTYGSPVALTSGGASFTNALVITASATPLTTPAAALQADVTAAGGITVTLLDGSTSVTIPYSTPGTYYLPLAVSAFTAKTGTLTVTAFW